MCGIAGIVGGRAQSCVASMVAAMSHRGPDDRGIFCDGDASLGMARLAVIDPTAAGRQPMRSRDGLVTMVYNGETYNFRHERAVLESRGQVFASQSDTEVVLRMYEVYGDRFLQRLRGMFALAIYDRRGGQGKERLLLARDHLGVKPLLYSQVHSQFLFASELKAILASGLVPREIDPEGLRLLLTFGSVAQPRTIVGGVKMLPPGCSLVLERGQMRIERFWTLAVGRRQKDIAGLPYAALVDLVRHELEQCVRLQMVSDVPLGAFLSGGVDSSLLVALMARSSNYRIKTFSIGFEAEGAAIDETADAQRVASFVGTDHHRVVVTGADVRDHIHRIAAGLDQPSVDGVNSYFVSMAARQAVTVAISGTGGDELFAGYPWFITMVNNAQRDAQRSLGAWAGAAFSQMARMPVFDSLACGTRISGRLQVLRAKYGFVSQYARIFQIFGACGAAAALSAAMKAAAFVGRDPGLDLTDADEMPASEPLERVSALCLRGYTQNQLLRDIDAVSMAHSLEVRVPFLDPDLADLALSLPREAKLGTLEGVVNPETSSYRETGTKRILVDASQGLLPPGMDKQPKRGFAMPFDSWLKGSLREVFEDTLSVPSVRRRGVFDDQYVDAIRRDLLDGRASWAQPWLLMMTELWCREVLDVR